MGKFKDTTTTKWKDTSTTEFFSSTVDAICAESINFSAPSIRISNLFSNCVSGFSLHSISSFGLTVLGEMLENILINTTNNKNALFYTIISDNIQLPSTSNPITTAQAICIVNFTIPTITSFGSIFSVEAIENFSFSDPSTKIASLLSSISENTLINAATTKIATHNANAIASINLIDVSNTTSIWQAIITDNILLQTINDAETVLVTLGELAETILFNDQQNVSKFIESIAITTFNITDALETIFTFNVILSDNVAIDDVFYAGQTLTALCNELFNVSSMSLNYEANGKVTITFTLSKSILTT